jgi:peptide/nickel transport system permease protein
MVRYLAARAGQAVLVLWITYTIVFVLIQTLPSDPVTIFLASDAGADQELIDRVSALYGYDRPWFEQYAVQLGNLLRGEFGFSLSTGQSVLDRIGSVVGSTLALASTGLLLSVLIAILISAVAFLVDSPRLRAVIVAAPSLFSSIPVFWLGIVVLQVFSFQLRILSLFPDGSLLSLLIPALVLAIPVSAPIAQVLLTGVEQASELAFVKTARAKGARPFRVFWHHVFRSSLGATTAVIGTTLGVLIAGSVITETVFARPGLGSVLLRAVIAQDVPLVQGLVFLTTMVVVVAALVVDLVTPLLDPRVLRSVGSRGVSRLGA